LRREFRWATATKVIDDAERDINLPVSIHTSFQGTAAAFRNSLTSEPLLIPRGDCHRIYRARSLVRELHPSHTILSTLPSAGVGAIVALILTRNDLSILGLIGIILLIGIVKKNAIMMIDFAIEAERVEGKTPEEAIIRRACFGCGRF